MNQRYKRIVWLLLVLSQTGCSPWWANHSPDHRRARPGLQAVQSFAVIYRHVSPDELAPFEMIILEPEHFRRHEIQNLRQQGKIIFGYVNVGEIEEYRAFADRVPDRWKLADNQHWPGHTFVHPKWKGWRKLLQTHVLNPMQEKGFDGFFLDSVDIAAPWRFPETRKDMIRLIRWIRKQYPEKMLILNNGLFLAEALIEDIHGLLIEELFFTVDSAGRYDVRPMKQRLMLLKDILRAKTRWDLPVFLVDYCPEPPPQICRDIKRMSGLLGLPHFVTDYHLTRLYPELNAVPVNMQMQ